MEVTVWNNGQHSKTGAGYGIKISIGDRAREFDHRWEVVTVDLEGGESVSLNVAKKSFWNDSCRELIHADIGRWLLGQRLAPWPNGRPPKLQLLSVGNGRFKLGRL